MCYSIVIFRIAIVKMNPIVSWITMLRVISSYELSGEATTIQWIISDNISHYDTIVVDPLKKSLVVNDDT